MGGVSTVGTGGSHLYKSHCVDLLPCSCVSSVEGRADEDKENSPMLLDNVVGGEDKENSPLLLARPPRMRCQEPPRGPGCQEPPRRPICQEPTRRPGCQEPSCLKLPGSKEALRARHPILSLTAMLEEEVRHTPHHFNAPSLPIPLYTPAKIYFQHSSLFFHHCPLFCTLLPTAGPRLGVNPFLVATLSGCP